MICLPRITENDMAWNYITFSLCSGIRYGGIQLMNSITIFGAITSDLEMTSIIHP